MMPLNSKGPATGRRTARLEWQNRCWSDHKRGNGPGKAVCVADQGRITSEFVFCSPGFKEAPQRPERPPEERDKLRALVN